MGRKSKLTERQWAQVRQRVLDGEKVAGLAREFGIAPSTMREKISGETETVKILAKQIAAMSKKSKLADKQIFIRPRDGEELTGDQEKQFELANRLLNLAANEESLMFLLNFWLETNALARIFSLPKINRWKFEMTVEYGRIDLALFHVNGDITIVEAKAGLDIRATVAGIGQLFLYESANKEMPNNKKTKIRKVLCAQCMPEHMVAIVQSCVRAGISFVPIPRIDLVRGIAYEHLIARGDHGL